LVSNLSADAPVAVPAPRGRPLAAVHHHFLRIAAHDAVAARVVEGIRNAASHAGGGAWPPKKKADHRWETWLWQRLIDQMYSNVGSQQEAANIKLHGGLPMLAEWS